MRRIKIGQQEFNFEGHEDGYLNGLQFDSESSLERYAQKFIPNNASIIDVGANIGFVSALISVHNPSARIYAIEPGLRNFEFLSKNIESNKFKNIYPFNFACGSKEGFANFYENSAWGHVDLQVAPLENDAKYTIRVKTIDGFVQEEKLERVDLIKIDVEGFESYVFEGMVETIARFQPRVIFEFNTFCMIAYGRTDPYKFLEMINTQFKNKYRLTKDVTSPDLLIPISEAGFVVNTLHENIVTNHSVEDYLVF